MKKQDQVVIRQVKSIKLALCFALGALTAWLALPSTQASQNDFFQQKVAPILNANCAGCHGAKIQRGQLDLRSAASILKGGGRGPAVVPGAPEKSVLYRMLTHQEEPAMPLGGEQLSAADLAVIATWIKEMKPAVAASIKVDAVANTGYPTRKPGYKITDKDRAFWSFMKPVRPTPPTVKNPAWVRNEIDAFVLNKLTANNLTPAVKAAPRELLRRVYFDLIGLPPTPEEMAAWLKNPSDKAYDAVLEKLLASQHYGERWGRHWLDLARYADSGGYEFDYDRPHAWRYRDYVIQAFNADKPFDQFIREQLANDLIAGAQDPANIVPTGFLRNGPTVDNVENEETRTDELDDMVSTTSSVFMGLTVGCARCHDHKYDPLPTRDYYRLQAVFFPYKKAELSFANAEQTAAFKAENKVFDEKARPFKEQIRVIEQPIRERLMRDKVDFHTALAKKTSGFGALTEEQFRTEIETRLRKEVNLQIDEIQEYFTPAQAQQHKALSQQLEAVNKQRPKPLPAAMGVGESDKPEQAHIMLRGNHRTKGDPVFAGFPTVLGDGSDCTGQQNPRQQLAQFVASAENPLTARVAVNRIWQYHFGRGLVATPSDFGLTGDRPTHPELLDWLATELVKQGWSWKQMHRLILHSNTYQQSSQLNAALLAQDPENKLLAHFHQKRLEAELIRDSILAVSGKLNPQMFGEGFYPRIDPDIINTGSRPRWPLDAKDEAATFRRSVYIFVKRSVLLPLAEVFDCPITVVPSPLRPTSTVAPQALALMNNQFILEQAGYFAARVAQEAPQDQIRRAFSLALNRAPSPSEWLWANEFIKKQQTGYVERKDANPAASAMRDFCHALFNLNEFLFVD